METTFITIHDLTPEARILYSSDSIVDVLGHTPDEVVNRSTWDFFNPSDIDSAKQLHNRSITMDKASVLVYCDIVNRDGALVRCECCFSIVYNVMVACTSVYSQGPSGAKRRTDAPIARRLFSSSPADPRYHMLQHLSARFKQEANEQSNEPRAALFLNRFTRTLTIMYATSGVESIVGISGEDMKGRSFYHCIGESCLTDAVSCLETAKGNDSIAYLRFMFRDPRQDDEPIEDTGITTSSDASDAEMTDVPVTTVAPEQAPPSGPQGLSRNSSLSSGEATPSDTTAPLELEAIVSCTSDGLVVCLRRARTPVPSAIHNTYLPNQILTQPYVGYFAAPWGLQPVYHPSAPIGFGPLSFPGMPMAYGGPPTMAPTTAMGPSANATDQQAFLRAIQECGVFAWDLVGINGTLADVARGQPAGRASPPEGPAVWTPEATTGAG